MTMNLESDNKTIEYKVNTTKQCDQNILSKARNMKKKNDPFELMALRFNLQEKIEKKQFDFEVMNAELQLLKHCWKILSPIKN